MDVHQTNLSDSPADVPHSTQQCMFPGCKSKVPTRLVTCDTTHALEIAVAVLDCELDEWTSKPKQIIKMVSCESHGHIMKARGLKKDMELQQYSHMRNVYTTLHGLVRQSCHDLLQEIGEY